MEQNRLLDLENGVNFRELGGIPVGDDQQIKWRKLLRSGGMGRLTKNDQNFLVDYGLKYDVDLRSDSEVMSSPDQLPNTIVYRQLSVYPFTDPAPSPSFLSRFEKLFSKRKPKQHHTIGLAETYQQMITDSHSQAAYRGLFDTLLENQNESESVVFHCTAGKDRTGVGAMLVLGALGVDQELITRDYLLTNLVFESANSEDLNNTLMHGADKMVNSMNVMSAQAENVPAVFAAVDTLSGSLPQYLNDYMGVNAQDLQDLKNLYLETRTKNDLQ